MAVDWSAVFTARYRWVRVDRSTGLEGAEVDVLSGGTITRDDSDEAESATAEVVGDFDIGSDLLRAYLDAEWADGSTEAVMLGTFLASAPSRDIGGARSTATVDMYGRLHELAADAYGAPSTVAAGTLAVDAARSICEEAGLEVVSEDSAYALSTVRTYGAGEDAGTPLEAVTDLLDCAGFDAPRTDTAGRVTMEAHVDPAARPVVWTFKEGGTARFLDEATDERDRFDVPNRAYAVYATEDETIVGEAVDESGGDFSHDTVGRWVTVVETYSELPEGDDADAMQGAADAQAAQLLTDGQSVAHRVTMTCAYCPIDVGDVVELDWPTGGIEGEFVITTIDIEMGAGCLMTLELEEVVA